MYNTMPFMGEDIRVLIREKSLHIENTESLRRVLKKKHAPLKLVDVPKEITFGDLTIPSKTTTY
ncbi:hypothetical protein ACT453_02990, partial [Bacillus sp. D-CC]